ncbi:hypothetical protein KA082_00685 [Candidatus Woesebacteria bacterium]|nr:hypothetical protein [Candidatus Woesebacteria bacterium]
MRLFHIQIVNGEKFKQLVDANRFFTVILPKERGVLLDRYGVQLVYNQPLYFKLKNPDRLYGEKVLIDRTEALQLLAVGSEYVAMENTRWYPLAGVAAHILGYVGPVTAEDIQKNPTLRASDIIGKFGLERKYDDLLSGTTTKKVYEINALGKKIRLVETQQGKPGTSLTTTLDPYLMTQAALALGERTGVVVISDAQTGALLALVSSPSFDPNILSDKQADPIKEKERKKTIQAFFDNPQQLFFNRAIAGAYPPGSVFKLVIASAGLETGSFDEKTEVVDEGVLKVGDYSYANWYYSQYGRVEGAISLQRAIARSNDIYFYKAAEWIGPEKIAEFARLFGYGVRSGIELSGEAAGFVPTPAWKEEKVGEKWFLGNTYHFGIGQGDLLVTPLQVNQMTQAIANHGELCQPSVLMMDTKQCKGLGFSEEHLETIVRGMLDACSVGGTAFPFFEWNTKNRVPELAPYKQLAAGAVGCKTGTAEFGATTALNKKKTHAWFTAIVGTQHILENGVVASASSGLLRDYTDHAAWMKQVRDSSFPDTIAVTVLLESDEAVPYKEGSRDAGPVVKKIIDWMAGVGEVKKKTEE